MPIERHEHYMRRCIQLARIAQRQNNTPVGSIVVANDDIVGEGVEALPTGTQLTGHAEVIACQAAIERLGSRELGDATIYTTAEPCFMCSYVIRQACISTVVYGVTTPNIGGITSRHPILTDTLVRGWNRPPRIISDVLANECRELRS